MISEQIKQLDSHYIAQTYGRFDLVLSHGNGCEVWDSEGNKYLDFTSGIGTNSLGWGDTQWVAAVAQQAAKLQHCSNLFYSEPAAQLAEKLAQASGLKRAFFCNSGAEANEGAIKTARKYSADKYGANRSTIITLENSFHGRTLSTLAATGQAVFHQHFSPFTAGFEHLPPNDLAALTARLADNDVCAVMLEIVQGEGGVNSLTQAYLQGVQALCHQQDVLLIIDEVQTGIGRTGSLFAYQQFDLTPDIVTLAKGLGGGLPIGAFLLGEKCQDTLGKGDHGSTYGGNPVCCAAANVVLDRLDTAFLNEVQQKSAWLRARLAVLPKVKSVSGLGLMIGVEFEAVIDAQQIVAEGIQHGLLMLTAKQKLRLLPPLTISQSALEQGIAILTNILISKSF
ncbi:aspartate aminotransferase family protein [Muribacter muris]|uniref:Acetylornithine aminotransferase n=1 Tax=Muribacter muris TaxID=67855 RepID=A0A4Y9JUZ5_9PAST|nr:aspartate aminotransferase family protein [Muribacter muris]MBF0785360.1 aspartate aminotransferase family protein [Muribacter muris]MBF0826015.1 aspartate aminotransferase family protein [Muribacter muris]TFV09623.1 aspartate aminotransferase family protein [Muribacter muris]